ncbi:MAG: alpha-amylase family glycosyl hydrolase [Oscillospiraceae bacterium]|nr:alpha-amylase family glycosyl hydrolase [Oscillospiraceae bacterium]
MKNVKKLLCLILALATLVSMSAIGYTVSAAEADTVQTAAGPTAADDFTWDNATVYFLLTDRFNNGNKENDNSYERNDGLTNTVAAFQGGDFKGITQKINEGYFDKLGVNAIWVAGWYEQTHGYVVGGDGKKSFPHYSYHGYYGLDFTELDKNFGTEAEFKEMIDAAHSRGIRIVLDVVLNHPGYNSIYDMNEYGFGTLTSNAMNVYNNEKNNPSQTNYHGVIKYNDGNASDWAKWWGKDWIRAGLAGYDNNGGGDLTGSVAYLPDFKTENQASLDIPEILKTKWTREGTYNEKVNEINDTMQKYNLGNKTVANYLVSWYAKWVEEYGIDGFRCDTAKHVDMSVWGKLSAACTQALKNWRAANPSAPGADWDEDFWTTGECFGMGLALGSNYYTTGGFDSMINFSFSADSKGGGCTGMKKAGNLNNTYASYASAFASNPGRSVLTYISSHDTGMCRDDLYFQGSALLLMPGAVQIYYGDESNRQQVSCTIWDHVIRGFMNWTSMDNGVLTHWQKVGTFRNNHVAVGAGSHTALSATGGTAFSRNYNKNGVNDTVVCVVGANNNTSITITLNGAFKDGVTVKNTYTGDTAQVSGGKVTFNSGAHGTILIEQVAGDIPTVPTTAPTTPTKPTTAPTKPTTPIDTEYVLLGDADLNDEVNIKDATAVQKATAGVEKLTEKETFAADVNKDEEVNVKDATAIQKHIANINTGYDINKKVVYKQGTVAPTTPDPVEPTTAPTVPTDPVEPSENYVYLRDSAGWGSAYIHYWSNSSGSVWPGEPMESMGNNLYRFAVGPEYIGIVFNYGGNEKQTGDLTVNYGQVYDNASNQWSSL